MKRIFLIIFALITMSSFSNIRGMFSPIRIKNCTGDGFATNGKQKSINSGKTFGVCSEFTCSAGYIKNDSSGTCDSSSHWTAGAVNDLVVATGETKNITISSTTIYRNIVVNTGGILNITTTPPNVNYLGIDKSFFNGGTINIISASTSNYSYSGTAPNGVDSFSISRTFGSGTTSLNGKHGGSIIIYADSFSGSGVFNSAGTSGSKGSSGSVYGTGASDCGSAGSHCIYYSGCSKTNGGTGGAGGSGGIIKIKYWTQSSFTGTFSLPSGTGGAGGNAGSASIPMSCSSGYYSATCAASTCTSSSGAAGSTGSTGSYEISLSVK